ncbi:PTS ascorbate transporter subunit IIC [Anaerosacchariphilus polymeriproducens]|uniref:Ascorbate-specific PTS system EIIC component n=1 Tax=Anaerosacchariphilus polymeriproducens TaxID=1812858 RepID=A0A371AXI2_9FIRM|nr:PTS ascorbate transporter subunit IIC [Anaerosacchariphilus polymeriproducens]RDU24269.1 PTS ascorbate transporter subunit IIC [Anaerosacchariphilus polymeriproducens]
MASILNFIQQILSTPAIFVGLIALIGLILQKSNVQNVVKGTIKTILGFLVLSAGASVIQQAIIPFGDLFQVAFGVQGVVPNNEAITSLGLNEYAVQTASIFALGMCLNILMARFSKWKYIFLTGHHALYMSCLISIIFSIGGLSGWKLILSGALLLGFIMAMFPAIMQPTMKKVTGDDSLALGHFGSCGYWLSAQIGKAFGTKKEMRTTEDVNFPKGLSFLRDNTISISIAMFICYIIVSGVAEFTNTVKAEEIFNGTNWVLYSVMNAITFSAGIYIVLAGVRMLIAEIVPAFKGISEKLVPNAKPALDCPIVFPYAPNAVLIGFLCSFTGGVFGLIILAFMGNIGLAAAIILPGAVVHFFCGATAGVCGNATGGLKGCIVGAFVHGIAVTLLAAFLLPVLGSLGFASTTFSDADFTVIGIIFGNLSKVISADIIFVLMIVMFMMPILYSFTIGRKKNET